MAPAGSRVLVQLVPRKLFHFDVQRKRKLSLLAIVFFNRSPSALAPRANRLRLHHSQFIFSSSQEKPQHACEKISQVDVWEFAVRPLWNGINIPDECQDHGYTRNPGKNMCADAVFPVDPQVTRQSEADQCVGNDETVSGERSHPP